MNNNKEFSNEDIMMFVDGELSAEKTKHIERIIETDSYAQELFNKYSDYSEGAINVF